MTRPFSSVRISTSYTAQKYFLGSRRVKWTVMEPSNANPIRFGGDSSTVTPLQTANTNPPNLILIWLTHVHLKISRIKCLTLNWLLFFYKNARIGLHTFDMFKKVHNTKSSRHINEQISCITHSSTNKLVDDRLVDAIVDDYRTDSTDSRTLNVLFCSTAGFVCMVC